MNKDLCEFLVYFSSCIALFAWAWTTELLCIWWFVSTIFVPESVILGLAQVIFLSFTKFIENIINIYISKNFNYKKLFHNSSNDTYSTFGLTAVEPTLL